jgi:uncharacterized membrane protein (UPF0136 family)
MFASALSLLTLLVTLLAWLQWSSWLTLLALVLGAACLAVVAPFDAPTPRERWRVVIACAAYTGAVGAAVIAAQRVEAPVTVMVPIVLLVLGGVSLVFWALATRKRRRIPASRRYYDF